MILFRVRSPDPRLELSPALRQSVLVMANGREAAKTRSFKFLSGDPDKYEVEPVTRHGEKLFFDLTVQT